MRPAAHVRVDRVVVVGRKTHASITMPKASCDGEREQHHHRWFECDAPVRARHPPMGSGHHI